MATEIEYALMAGRAYQSTRSDINLFPALDGWSEPLEKRQRDASTGFEAGYFQRGTEIVISYAGTNPDDGIFPLPGPDNVANIGLATGLGSVQLVQAAEYYLQVKVANPTASITFTGHSLGGGLAALMGVFFGRQAVTFDQAPFANSATVGLLHPDVVAHLKSSLLASGHTEAELVGLTDFMQLRAVTGGIPNSSLVGSINVQGEFLSGVPWNLPDRIGAQTDIANSASGVSGFDLHSQALLTVFLQSMQTAPSRQALNDVTFKLTDLMGMIFSNSLFANPTDTSNTTARNFLERLVQNETANAMVTRFTSDLWKLAQDGGVTIGDDPAAATKFASKALTAFAMQMYYENTAQAANANKELFTAVTGGIQFDRADVAASLSDAKGYNLYFQHYLNTAFSDSERHAIQLVLPALRDWYVQAGGNAMSATDTHNRGAFMLGNGGVDTLTGGSQNDLLVGNAGNDTLNGGVGADTMLGGQNDDTYYVDNAGDVVTESVGNGTDTVQSAISYTLTEHVEDLTLTGTAISGMGNSLDNLLIGNAADNILEGRGGDDRLEGGGGFDTYVYRTGEGADRITDADSRSAILYDGHLLQAGVHRAGDAADTYRSLDGRFTYQQQGSDLLVNGALTLDGAVHAGQFGIRLVNAPSAESFAAPSYDNGLATRTEFARETSPRSKQYEPRFAEARTVHHPVRKASERVYCKAECGATLLSVRT